MTASLQRFLGYFSYLQKAFGFWSACRFMFYYINARVRGDTSGKLHYIPVGLYAFYFPAVEFFAGLFNEIFFKEEYYLDKTDKPLHVLDCGANIGVALLYIKLQAPNAAVMCFEPNPAACAVLQKNIEANGWQKTVTVVQTALGSVQGEADFYIGGTDTDSSGTLVPNADVATHPSYKVKVDVLSNYLSEKIDFLKMDIEGAEFEVLEEAAPKLANVQYMQLEYHNDPGSQARPLSALLTFLESHGFGTAIQNTTHPHLMQKGWRSNCVVYAWR